MGQEGGTGAGLGTLRQPVAQRAFPSTCTAEGLGALAYNRALGRSPQNRVPLTEATRAGWEENQSATGCWGRPWEPLSSCSKRGLPEGEKVASCSKQSCSAPALEHR